MTIKSIQKVIKVGDSIAVTIPAKDAKALGIKAGMFIQSSHELLKNDVHEENIGVAKEYEKFSAQYGEALKNLADR
ncbi:hypothetical protein KC992_00890 [Candidatus Saccharibacteria bacterium]|nr:hypothetical protein [Candidatus Saccharibacteria bacterium]